MKKSTSVLLAVAAAIAGHGGATAAVPSLSEIAARMASAGCTTVKANYEVLLPSAADPVVYDMTLGSAPSPADTLSPCSYLIDWTLHAPGGDLHGFSAYADGHHYRFRDTRLQEYHIDWDPAPFAPAGKTDDGVQCQAQFADLLPQFMARRFADMAADTARYHVAVRQRQADGAERIVVDGEERMNGYVSRLFSYVLDSKSMLPIRIDLESNPGSISEQSVTVRFDLPDKSAPCPEPTEQKLMERYPGVFETYRTENFRIENMPGHALPGFSARTPTGERYSRSKGDAFAVPTVIVFLDTEVGSTAATIKAVRDAVDALPMTADVIWAFTGNDDDAAEQAAGHTLRPGEHLLMSVKSLARDCGITAAPSLLICSTDGKVDSVVTSFNNELRSIVIQKVALAAR